MVEPSDTPEQPGGGTSGFEKADKAMNVAGRAASAVGTGIVKLWGLIILAAGIAIIAILPEAWWAGVLVALYGLYLVWPGGNKWVIY